MPHPESGAPVLTWLMGVVAALVVVAVVAVLLLAIRAAARRILEAAGRILAAVEGIRQNTLPLWALPATNQVAGGLREAALSIATHTGQLAQALAAPDRPGADG